MQVKNRMNKSCMFLSGVFFKISLRKKNLFNQNCFIHGFFCEQLDYCDYKYIKVIFPFQISDSNNK